MSRTLSSNKGLSLGSLNATLPRSRDLLISQGVLALLTALAYIRVRNCGFTNYDDNLFVSTNPHVLAGLTLDGVWWAFTSIDFANWHPLTWISFQLDSTLFLMNPVGFHVTNVLLHLASTLILFRTLAMATRFPGRSFVVAALFAVHPLHVQSVAWISERKDVLSGLFWMLALRQYLRPVIENQPRRMGWVAVWMACGLMSKAMGVTLPFVLLLLDIWPLRRWTGTWPDRQLIIEKVPLFVLAALGCAMTIYTQAADEAVGTLTKYPVSGRMATTVMNYGIYLRQLIWPYPLVAFYPHVAWNWSDWRVWSVLTLLLVVTAMVIWQRRSRPWLLVGWLWYLGTLVPVIGLVQVGVHAHADRYMYLPMIGPALMLVWLVAEVRPTSKTWQKLRLGLAGFIVAACGLRTALQTAIWRDSKSLWTYTLAHGEESATAFGGLGEALRDEGQFEQAIISFRKALELWPELAICHTNLGWCYAVLGRLSEADAEFAYVLPEFDAPANEQLRLGIMSVESHNPGRAAGHFVRALVADRTNCRARLQLAVLFMDQQQYAAARREFAEVQRCDSTLLTIPGVRESIDLLNHLETL